ncbi:putative MFS monosaccharide transporter [Aspergillus clavatus NRRL 1]|uniref:MFS transporter, putative n=1 Tax=Aspergillus clavatus (strain ATCC 1007 / CBS 513.65 / DSM 816 / NCTC 3887 / NRRL 1 / QM 1276 / 107) TaxID=344612 RepID=A1CGX1_ASPCL|nr:MFS transporter, putative [Aspergillus clavatus NRRL 1]EAW10126.1 MFS transporter, putative [Aspergillus clavatus NRRL 1]
MGADRRPEVLVVSIIFFVLATVFVALRFVSRIFVVRRVGLHDYLMLLAWAIDFGFSFSLFYATSKGMGLHDYDIQISDRPGLNRADYAFTVLYNPALMAVKTSILVFYLTLTKGEKVFRWANYITLFAVNAAGLALTLVNVFQCSPVSAAFSYPLPPHAHCIDILTLYLSSSPVNIITDLAILFIPNPILTQMRLPRKQKIILVITFSFGFFVAVVDVIRIAYIQSAATSRQIALKDLHYQSAAGDDFSWYASLSFMWSVIEVNVSVMCACVPSLKPLVARLIPKLIRDTDDNTQNTAEMNQPPSLEPAAGLPQIALPPSSPLQTGNARKKASQSGSRSSGSVADTREAQPQTMDMLEFLTAPESVRQDTEANTATGTSSSSPHSITFFDFVNMSKPTSMLKLTNRESIAPNALTTILFFLWGFAYGFLDILNSQFQQVVRLDSWRSLGLHAVYFGGYLVGPPLVGRVVLKRWGFKSTFITGLCIYACGTLIFWPSAVLTSYSAFTISNFIVGFGLAVLETAANPFIALCGPLENSEVRLNISQGVQAIGSVVSPLLAKRVLFKQVTDVGTLVDVQWAYLGIALFDVLLAVAFYYLPIPEASDEDLEELASRRREDNMTRVLGVPVVWMTLGLGVFSQFFYVAGQEVLSQSYDTFVDAARSDSSLSAFDYLTIGHSVFAVGRFIAAFLQWFLKPRWILMLSYIGMIVFAVLCMKTSGSTAVAMSLMVYLFESGAFSIIFALSLRGTARHTKTAASLLTTAISGGAFLPFAQYAVQLAHGVSASYSVLVALFCAGAIFPLYLNLVPAAKKQVDPVPNEYLRRHRRRSRNRMPPSARNAVPREKDNPAVGGVLSRRRSVLTDPLPTIHLPETEGDAEGDAINMQSFQPSSKVSSKPKPKPKSNRRSSSSSSSSGIPRGGGIMHDLAPWPDT